MKQYGYLFLYYIGFYALLELLDATVPLWVWMLPVIGWVCGWMASTLVILFAKLVM